MIGDIAWPPRRYIIAMRSVTLLCLARRLLALNTTGRSNEYKYAYAMLISIGIPAALLANIIRAAVVIAAHG